MNYATTHPIFPAERYIPAKSIVMRKKERISREEAISFLLTHIVVERACSFEMNQFNLFQITTLAAEAQDILSREEEAIPHEIMEGLAIRFIEQAIK